MTTEINKKEVNEIQVGNSPADMIRMAVSGGADLAQLEKLLELQQRWEANEAKKAFNKSMALFKANPPTIEKDRKVAFDKTKYNYASLANVTRTISTELSKYGLSASWTTKQNGVISVTCKITHELGHSEETTISADADKTGCKNSIQAIGSTITYLERYSLLALTGLATEEMDDDGRSAEKPVERINDKELSTIVDLIVATETDELKLLKWAGIENLEDLPKSKFQQVVTTLKGKVKK